MAIKYLNIPQLEALPAPVYFRYDEFGADTHSAAHRHAWGQLNYAAHGIMHLEIDGQRFISPPHYAVWVPPDTEHSCYNPQAIVYRSVYLDREVCEGLPGEPCTLVISDILKAILGDFAARDVKVPQDPADQRLAQVLVDQLRRARPRPVTCPTLEAPVWLKYCKRCTPSLATNARSSIGLPVCMSANAPWPGSSFASWA